MLKQWLISEYWRAQGIYEIFRTNKRGIGCIVELLIINVMLSSQFDSPYPIQSFAYPMRKYVFLLY